MSTTKDEQFQKLIRNYNIAVETTSGCGSRGQFYIDNAFEDISKFVKDNPEYQSKATSTPYRCDDDGAFGMISGLSSMKKW